MIDATEKVGSVLVIGAGIAGIQASLDLAESGFKVYLVDRQPSIGGNMVRLDKTFPTGDCSMCIISPKVVGVGRHPGIKLLTYHEVKKVEGNAGNFKVTLIRKPRYVDPKECNGCGDCFAVCPVKMPSEFDQSLGLRGAIYRMFPQALPNVATIDKEHCINCGLCEIVCGRKAIRMDDKPEEFTVNAGAVIVSTGFQLFDPSPLEEYGYGRYKNVLTSLQFERLLSASGPTAGHVVRPSDGKEPEKVAFIQCVGSRDAKHLPYCSRICCMASTKEAIIAKEHSRKLKPYILYMDMRAFGKGFQENVNRAKDEYGVEFVRARVSEIREDEGKNLILSYEDTEKGTLERLEVGMAVLASALQPSPGNLELAKILGVELDSYGFFRELVPERPFQTTRPGIFINGTCNGPKDIPDSVSQASGAAAQAEVLLEDVRRKEIERKEKTPERALVKEPRIGVFVCHCGMNIGSVVDVEEVAAYARTLPNVVYAKDTMYTCSDDTQVEIQKVIREQDLNRIVVASCTPRTHEPLFRSTCEDAGLNPYLLEMANIREHCSWVHSQEPERATSKAKDLVRMAVAKVRLLAPQQKGRVEVERKALVLGGGIAGMTAALEIANQGFHVHLLERSGALGGATLAANTVFFSGRSPEEVFGPLMEAVSRHPNVRVHLSSTAKEIKGFTGNFEVTILESGAEETLKVGGILLATGSRELKPEGLYLYGSEGVMTLGELEGALKKGDKPRSTAFIQCVGARTKERPYCSRACCIEAVKNAIYLKERDPSAEVYILYRDLMTFGFYEDEYRRSQALGVKYLKYSPEGPPRVERSGGKLKVSLRDVLLRADAELEVDRVVLSTPQVPAEGVEDLAKLLKLPRSPDGFFMEGHAKLKPLEFTQDGIYLCGSCQGPKELPHVIAQASGAAARLCALLSKEFLETEATTAVVDEEFCIGCGRCTDVCPFGALALAKNEKGEYKSRVNSALCKSCGACAAVCPNGAITPRNFSRDQIIAMIDELLEVPHGA